jgi:hypothetical protein
MLIFREVNFKGFTKQTGRLIKFETDFTLYLFYTSFCVRRSSFWVKTQAPGQTTFVLSKCN